MGLVTSVVKAVKFIISSNELKYKAYENILKYLEKYDCKDELNEIMSDENDKNKFIDDIWLEAVCRGDIEIIQELINSGMDNYVDEKEFCGYTALMVASQRDYFNIVVILLKNNAKVDEKDYNDDTALIFASQKGHFNIVEILLEYNANVNEKNNHGNTSLMVASFYNHLEVVKFLLEKGANLNEKSNDEWTTLMVASKYGYFEVVKLLMENGADENIQNKCGKTAIQLTKNEEIREFIDNYNSTKFVLK